MNDLKAYALGAHGWFFKEGSAFTVPAAGEVAVDALPGQTDPEWLNRFIGDCESFEDTKNVETVEVKKANPGILVRKDIITFFQSLDFKMTTNSLKRLAFELFYGSSVQLTDAVGTFAPLASPPPSGWLKLQRYTQENELVFAADLWVRAEVTGGMGGGQQEIIKPEYSFKLLDSELNTMFFGDPSLLD